jgi:hypothetical protein
MLARFAAESVEVAEGGVSDHDAALLAHEKTHRAHASPPAHHIIPISLEPPRRRVDLLRLLNPKCNPFAIPNPTALKIEAGQTHSRGQIPD